MLLADRDRVSLLGKRLSPINPIGVVSTTFPPSRSHHQHSTPTDAMGTCPVTRAPSFPPNSFLSRHISTPHLAWVSIIHLLTAAAGKYDTVGWRPTLMGRRGGIGDGYGFSQRLRQDHFGTQRRKDGSRERRRHRATARVCFATLYAENFRAK